MERKHAVKVNPSCGPQCAAVSDTPHHISPFDRRSFISPDLLLDRGQLLFVLLPGHLSCSLTQPPLSNSRQRVAHTIMHHLKAEEFFTTINSELFNQLPFSHVSWKAFSATHWLGFSKLSQYALVIELQPEKINWEGLRLCCSPRHAC